MDTVLAADLLNLVRTIQVTRPDAGVLVRCYLSPPPRAHLKFGARRRGLEGEEAEGSLALHLAGSAAGLASHRRAAGTACSGRQYLDWDPTLEAGRAPHTLLIWHRLPVVIVQMRYFEARQVRYS
jgi:hypothetical protein